MVRLKKIVVSTTKAGPPTPFPGYGLSSFFVVKKITKLLVVGQTKILKSPKS